MRFRIITLSAMMAMSLHLSAQSIAQNYKEINNGNPISASVFCADPTALEYNGRLYVYGTNDHQQFNKNNKKNGNGYGDIKSLVVLSTDDMVNWTFHGTIDVAKLCSSWGWGFAASWAPSVTWRVKEDGTEEFFLYFANSGGSVGVLKASSPIGPWTSPRSGAMITGNTSGVSPCTWCFDPGVVIDENGTGWIAFGGGDPNNKGTTLQPNNACIAKLKPSMTAIDGKAVKIPAPYHFEASELNIMDDKFVYTYCSSWSERKDADWNAYKKEHGISVSKPNTCTMCYMVSDDPMNPDSWVYKGVCGPHPGFPSPNNHSHLHKFQGNYYYFYHWAPLMKKMKDLKVIDSSCDGYRSICVNKATVNEGTQKINSVNQNLTGVTAIKNLNPYELQQAETTANSGGVIYDDFKNVKTNTKINSLGNDASENMYIKMAEGSWTMVRNADFGEGANSFMLRAKNTGKLEIRLDKKTAQAAATVEFSSSSMDDYTINVDPEVFKGKHNVYFVFIESDNKVQFDAWQFSQSVADGIAPVHSSDSRPTAIFDLSGNRIDGASHRGVVIEQYQDANGKKWSRKRLK